MAIAVIQTTGTDWWGDGESVTLTKSGADNLFAHIGFSKGPTGRTFTSATLDTAMTADITTPETAVSSIFLYPYAVHHKDASIPETLQTLAMAWSGAQNDEGTGAGLLLSGVDQTNPVRAQSVGIQHQGFDAEAVTDLTYNANTGDLILYLCVDIAGPYGDITNFTRVTTNPDTETTQADEGAIYYRIATSNLVDQTIPAPVSGTPTGMHFLIVYRAAATGTTPNISGISTPITTNTQTTVTGTGFEATQGTGAVTVGGEDVTESSWSDTSVQYTLDIESSVLKYGSHVVELTNNSGNSDTIAQVTNPISTHSYVNIGTPATSGDRITAAGDLATSDQVRYENILYDGVTPTAYGVSVADTGVFTISGGPPDGTYTFEVRVNDGTGWGTAADQTVVINTSGGGQLSGSSSGISKAVKSGIIKAINPAINR